MTQINLVEVLGEPRQWSGQNGGTFDSYKVKADDGTVYEINVKGGNPPPKLGPDEFDVTPPKEGTSFPPKLKRQFSGGGGGGQRNAAKDAYWEAKEQRDIEGIARMGRAHAQEMALRVLAIENPSQVNKDEIRGWIDWFQADVDAASPASPQTASAPSSQAPEPATTNQKRALTTALNRLGIDNPWQAKIVHAVAGDPPSKVGLSSLLDVVNDDALTERGRIDRLQELSGVTLAGSDAPADTSDLPDPEAVPF